MQGSTSPYEGRTTSFVRAGGTTGRKEKRKVSYEAQKMSLVYPFEDYALTLSRDFIIPPENHLIARLPVTPTRLIRGTWVGNGGSTTPLLFRHFASSETMRAIPVEEGSFRNRGYIGELSFGMTTTKLMVSPPTILKLFFSWFMKRELRAGNFRGTAYKMLTRGPLKSKKSFFVLPSDAFLIYLKGNKKVHWCWKEIYVKEIQRGDSVLRAADLQMIRKIYLIQRWYQWKGCPRDRLFQFKPWWLQITGHLRQFLENLQSKTHCILCFEKIPVEQRLILKHSGQIICTSCDNNPSFYPKNCPLCRAKLPTCYIHPA